MHNAPALRLLAAAAVYVVASVVAATPIAYTFRAVASGTLNGVSFVNRPLTLVMSADTSTIAVGGVHPARRNIATTTSLALDGSEIGPIGRPIAIAIDGGGTGGPYTIGVEGAGAVFPPLDFLVSGNFAFPGGVLSLLNGTAPLTVLTSPSVGSFAALPTSAGSLSITSLASLAVSVESLPEPAIDAFISATAGTSFSVQGATVVGNVITATTGHVVVQLGAVPGAAVYLTFRSLNIGLGSSLTFRAGAPGQSAVLNAALNSSNPPRASIAGTLLANATNGIPAASLSIRGDSEIDVHPSGFIVSPAGVSLTVPVLNNQGTIDGGSRLTIESDKVTGAGLFNGDSIAISANQSANNPDTGPYFLDNWIALAPSSGTEVALTLRTHSKGNPNVFNIMVMGDASLWAPSAFPPPPSADAYPFPNNAVVLPGGSLSANQPEATYGGGSMLLQATGSIRLSKGSTNDFVFPGAIVLKAAATLDVNGVDIIQGWTTAGRPFQGVFLESPAIQSTGGPLRVYTNNLNWVNFSTLPQAPVRTFTLMRDAAGTATYVATDDITPHLNTYSTIQTTAASGGCWQCVIDPEPVDVSGAPVCALLVSNPQPLIGTSIVLSASCTGNALAFSWGDVACSTQQCAATSLSTGPQTYSVSASNATGAGRKTYLTVRWVSAPTSSAGVSTSN